MDRGDQHAAALAVWVAQEGLLQSYRALFVTSESVVFSLAVASVAGGSTGALGLAVLGLVMLWTWHRVCTNRAKDVSFAQWQVLLVEEGNDVHAPLTALKSFQDGELITVEGRRVWRDPMRPPAPTVAEHFRCDELYPKLLRSRTRRRMEFELPLLFLILWLVLIGYAVALRAGAV